MVRNVAITCVLILASQGVATDSISFNRDVRPILSDRCFACHGPDEQSRAADLRLDDAASAKSEAHQVIVPGDAEQSEMIRRIQSTDPSEVMPPPEHGKPLSRGEIEVLQRWIDQGANFQQHWSLTKLARPPVPALASGGLKNPIDAFVRRKLALAKVAPAEPADSRTLTRRLSFDLTGLPPDPKLVAAPVQHTLDDHEKLVDHFLKSPHFGERMAMYWLDLVRYADTLGYHGDQPRSVSPYRDYVIRAFNENKPFDQFTIEQIAGDLIPNAELSQKVASTYNRLNRASGEGGVQPKEYLAKYSADRVRTTGAVWLGATLGCAECHDHKFDPFTTRDFYSFAAFFADIKEQGIVRNAVHIEKLPVPTADQAQRLEALTKEIAATDLQLRADTPELQNARAHWEQTIRADTERWTVLQPKHAESQSGATLNVLDDHSVLASGSNPERDVYRLWGQIHNLEISAEQSANDLVGLRLELLPHPSLPKNGPGRASNGNLVLHSVEMTIDGQRVAWQSAVASHSQIHHAPHYVINGHKHGWAILPRTGKPLQLVLAGRLPESATARDRKPTEATSFEIRMRQNHGSGHNIGRFRLSLSQDSGAGLKEAQASERIRNLILLAPEKRNDQQAKELEEAFRDSTPLLKDLRKRLARLSAEKEQLHKAIVTTLATTATQPRTIRVLPRGDWMDDSGEVVQPAVPASLPQPSRDDGSRLTRLDLALWMTASDNPLVARTFVNRLWMLMFGYGLARNLDDLGSQGQPPTHPELLDWLAVEFIESGWNIKHMIRLITTSETYQQSSQAPEGLLQRDPYNRLYARQSRWRLEAEVIRDNALAVSGLLNREIGGKSAKPYQPAGYWSQLNFPRRRYQQDRGPRQFRRGLYTHWQRTFLHPSLLAFDAPPREECTAQRSRSNTPLQSLVLLNDPTFVEAARSLASRVLEHETSGFIDRLRWLTQQTLMREPRADEVDLLHQLYENDLTAFGARPEGARKLLSIGETRLPEHIDHAELAAWTNVARVILNLHESIVRY